MILKYFSNLNRITQNAFHCLLLTCLNDISEETEDVEDKFKELKHDFL